MTISDPSKPLTLLFLCTGDSARSILAKKRSDAAIALAFADTYRFLNNRIGIFASLRITSLNRQSLRTRMDEIGRTKNAPDKA